MDVLGHPIDEQGPIATEQMLPIHRKAPDFSEQAANEQLLETGIKVIDLLCPFAKGGKVGLFGGAGVGKTVNMMVILRLNTVVIQFLPVLGSEHEKGMIFIMK